MFVRDLVVLLVLWGMAWWFVRHAHERPKLFAAWFVFAYCMTLSLIAFDMIMALDPRWYSALFGIYYFVTGMYGAVAAWTLITLRRTDATVERRHDLGKLVVTFGMLSTYMMYSQLLPIWYENLPQEVRFVIPRLTLAPWVWVSAVLLGVIYLGPLVFLLTRESKRYRLPLGIVAVAVLAALWVERWWLVVPTLDPNIRFGGAEVSITAAFLGLLGLSMEWHYRRSKAAPET
jgi:hypothetical protein